MEEKLTMQIMNFPITIPKDGELHRGWKNMAKEKAVSMRTYILAALKEKIARDKKGE